MNKVESALQQWEAWKSEGNAPRTRIAALKIVSAKLSVPMTKLKNGLSIIENLDGSEKINDNLSLIVWDLVENGGRLHNYDRDERFFADLLRQAGGFLYSYTRRTMKFGAVTLSIPTYAKTKHGATSIATMSSAALRTLATARIEEAKQMLRRWQYMGTNPREVIRLVQQAIMEFETDSMEKKIA